MNRIKKMENQIKSALLKCDGILLSFGLFIGLLFPEFTLNPDTVGVYYLDENGQRIYERMDAGQLYEELLQADEKEITIKSRLWENLRKLWEKD